MQVYQLKIIAVALRSGKAARNIKGKSWQHKNYRSEIQNESICCLNPWLTVK